jgi:hypothetical protein
MIWQIMNRFIHVRICWNRLHSLIVWMALYCLRQFCWYFFEGHDTWYWYCAYLSEKVKRHRYFAQFMNLLPTVSPNLSPFNANSFLTTFLVSFKLGKRVFSRFYCQIESLSMPNNLGMMATESFPTTDNHSTE